MVGWKQRKPKGRDCLVFSWQQTWEWDRMGIVAGQSPTLNLHQFTPWTMFCLPESIYNIFHFILHIAIAEAFANPSYYICIVGICYIFQWVSHICCSHSHPLESAKSQTLGFRHYFHAAESRYTATHRAFPYGSHSSLDPRSSTKAQR